MENKYSNEFQKIHPESGGNNINDTFNRFLKSPRGVAHTHRGGGGQVKNEDGVKQARPMTAHQLLDLIGAVMHATSLALWS